MLFLDCWLIFRGLIFLKKSTDFQMFLLFKEWIFVFFRYVRNDLDISYITGKIVGMISFENWYYDGRNRSIVIWGLIIKLHCTSIVVGHWKSQFLNCCFKVKEFMNRLIDWLIVWFIDWLIDWLINWLIDWLTDCLINWWPIDWLIAWLMDWLIE